MDGLRRQVRITHPFHPLTGREFELIAYRRSWGNNECVDCLDDQGRLVSILVAWTDAAEGDPFVVLSGGRAYFRIEDLTRLHDLIGELGS